MHRYVAIRYRRRASALGKMADAATTPEETARLLLEAMSWIQLAENDELLSSVPSSDH